MANHDSIMQIKGSPKLHSGCRLHLGTLAFSLLLSFGSALIVPAAAARSTQVQDGSSAEAIGSSL
ncbi:hypothetical protein [Neisseria polysaccharea]|uniref:hypothetical protein n=1 Tax=Neisseria polysaccharea TaxID=489 RepID=UPI0027E1FF4D|nr:hypothetical protein [Neisseria polysaccharea]